tara:strand:- start:710 stop:958 length:249 start_codon:yes stop_codon:yes gene_type:complete
MIKIIITITLLLFLLLLYKKLNVIDKKRNRKPKGIWYFTAFILFLVVLFLVILRIEKNTDKLYNPPSFDGENLKPGFFSEIE